MTVDHLKESSLLREQIIQWLLGARNYICKYRQGFLSAARMGLIMTIGLAAQMAKDGSMMSGRTIQGQTHGPSKTASVTSRLLVKGTQLLLSMIICTYLEAEPARVTTWVILLLFEFLREDGTCFRTWAYLHLLGQAIA